MQVLDRRTTLILVTGGSGFIGRHVCSNLAAHGANVIALDRRGLDGSACEPTCLSLECDITDKDYVERIFQQYSFTTIVHLASILNTASRENPLNATQVNIVGSLNILEAARKFRVPRVLYGSSISVYGSRPDQSRDGVLEVEPAAPGDVYGAAKRYVEIVGEVYRQRLGIQFVALRISSVIGPGAVNTASPWRSDIFEKLGLPHGAEVTIPYRSDEALPLVCVEDVAEMFACLVAAEQAAFMVYNTPSETWTLDELATYVESLDKNVRIAFGQSRVSGIPRVVNSRRFVTEFGYTPVSVKERLRRAARLRGGKTASDDMQDEIGDRRKPNPRGERGVER
jgi:UDP-glucose 4-epimerase